MDQPDNDSHAPSFWRRPAGMALATAAVIAGFYLLREHWGHVRLEWFAHLLSTVQQASTGAGWAGYPKNYPQR